MPSIKNIISSHRASLESAGLLKKAEAGKVPAQIKGLRPSLGKVNAALTGNPERFAVVQPSPFSTLFDIILPALEPQLVELGEEQAEQVIGRLCEYWQTMIGPGGPEEAALLLSHFSTDLLEYAANPLTGQGLPGFTEICWQRDIAGKHDEYARVVLNDLLGRVKVDTYTVINREKDLNLEGLWLKSTAADDDLRLLSRVKNIRALSFTRAPLITDAGLVYIGRLTDLRKLEVATSQVTDLGLAHLSRLNKLKYLNLENTRISDAGLMRLLPLANLKELLIGGNTITDAGLANLANLSGLIFLDLKGTNVTATGITNLEKLLPGLVIQRDIE